MLKRIVCTGSLALAIASSPAASPSQQLPSLGDSASSYVSLQQEHELGRLWLRQLRAHSHVIEDPLAVQFLEQTIYRLVPHSEVSINEFEFVIVDQRELNAFAVPGGIIGINYGLFLYTQDEDELSGVLAHELAHLSQRHFARQLEAADKQAPIAIATLLASILLIATNNPDIGFAGLIGSQAASIQRQLSYSREWEREADRVGIQTLAKADLDPTAMPSMFQQMLKASRYQQRPPEFLTTHPITEARIADAADRAENFESKPRTQSFEFLVLQQAATLNYQLQGEQRLQYLHNLLSQNLLSDEHRSATYYSLAKLQLQQHQTLAALESWHKMDDSAKDRSAAVALFAQILQQQNQPQKAVKVLLDVLPFMPKDYVLLHALASLYDQQTNYVAASDTWKQLADLRPNEPTVWKNYARSAHNAKQVRQALHAQAEFLFLTAQQPQALRQMELAIQEAKKEGNLKQQLALKQRQQSMASAPTRF